MYYSGTYNKLFRPSDKDLPGMINIWCRSLRDNGISTDIIAKAYKKSQNMSEFREYPPNQLQFIDICLDILRPKEKRDIFISFNKFSLSMRAMYGALWLIGDKDDKVTTNFWIDELIENNINSKSIDAACKVVKSSTEYIKYPPTLKSFLEVCKLSSLDVYAPSPELAYMEAVSGNSEMNFLVREARKRITSHSLNSNTQDKILPMFKLVYAEVISDYIEDSKRFVNNKNNKNNKIIKKDPVAEKEYLNSEFDKIISGL